MRIKKYIISTTIALAFAAPTSFAVNQNNTKKMSKEEYLSFSLDGSYGRINDIQNSTNSTNSGLGFTLSVGNESLKKINNFNLGYDMGLSYTQGMSIAKTLDHSRSTLELSITGRKILSKTTKILLKAGIAHGRDTYKINGQKYKTEDKIVPLIGIKSKYQLSENTSLSASITHLFGKSVKGNTTLEELNDLMIMTTRFSIGIDFKL